MSREFGSSRLPRWARAAVYAPFAAASIGILTAFPNCGSKGQESEPTPVTFGEISGVSSERSLDLDVEPFLRYPVPQDQNIRVVQGWVYAGYHDGQIHGGIDYIEGTDFVDSSNWSRRLTVMAPAEGKACQYSFISPPYGRNYAIKIEHPNGYTTKILHMNPSSINRRGLRLPVCGLRDNGLRPHVIAGDALGLAGDSGTEPGWFHAHWALRDPRGRLVDPYGWYGRRGLYPNTDGSDGGYCDDDALILESYYPREPNYVRVGAATIERSATPTQFVQAPTETPTEDLQNREAIAGLGSWQVAVGYWDEKPYRHTNYGNYPSDQYRDGWKYVSVGLRVRNKSASIVNGAHPSQNGEIMDFSIVSPQFPGETYQIVDGRELDTYHLQVPPGFSYPVRLGFWIPNSASDYSLRLTDVRKGQIAGDVQKGVTTREFANILPDVAILAPGQPWEVPGNVRAVFTRDFVNDCNCMNVVAEQFASFDIANLSGQDIRVGYGSYYGFEMRVFLADGEVVGQNPLFYSGEPNVYSPDIVVPGQTKRADLNFADTYTESSGNITGQIFDTRGAVFVLIYGDKWAAWQLP